jgi:superfamily II DNA helicase RecQ
LATVQNNLIFTGSDKLAQKFLNGHELSEEQSLTLNQSLGNKNLVVIAPYKNHSLYYQLPALMEGNDLTLVLMPVSSDIQKELKNLKILGLSGKVGALTSDLFPNQARRLIADVAAGAYKIFFLTPESFLYWFSSGFNSMAVEHYRRLAEDDLGKQVFMNTQAILKRITKVVFNEFQLISKNSIAHKPKYLEAIELISSLRKNFLALSFNASNQVIHDFLGLFPNTPIIYEPLRLERIALQAKYCFSRLDKQKYLVELLKTSKPTLVYVSPTEDLAELVSYLRQKLPNIKLKTFYKGLPTEQKAEALDYFLHDPCPLFITSSELTEGITGPNINRLIHFAPPNSLADFYKDIHILEGSSIQEGLAEAHLLVCEDDFGGDSTQEDRLHNLYNREGLFVKRKGQIEQFLNWLSQSKGCRWQNLEMVLTSNTQVESKCGICDLCLGAKSNLFGKMSLYFLKRKYN